ncbi:MAG: nucleotide exchange factor GrpE [Clostridia bacterium]|nr:nucleotide exchange factor GrpE [Clostridia bacterium]
MSKKMNSEEEIKKEQTAEEEVKEEETKVEEKKEEDEALELKYTRLMADFQNFKRRSNEEKAGIYQRANESIVVELLLVMDNFERAMEHAPEGDAFAEGVSQIYKQLQGVLDKNGVKEIEAQGLEFDPNFHNAVMTEDSDEVESGHIIQVLQKGYTLNGKVVRPSMVKVAN